jgi:hypothetical protein
MPKAEDLATALGGTTPRPPLQQETFDLDEHAFWATVNNPPLGILLNYHTDLAYAQTVDAQVLRYMLPWSMRAWQSALGGSYEARDSVDEFHAALSRHPNLIKRILGTGAQKLVEDFALKTLVVHASRHSSLTQPTLDWVPYWVGLTCGMPDLAASWWESMQSTQLAGPSTAFIAYITRIAYPPMHNPLFPEDYDGPEPWTRCIFITGGAHWEPGAVLAFGERAAAEHVGSALDRLCGNLTGDDLELGRLLADDFPHQSPLYTSRLQEVLAHLQDSAPPDYWTDACVV